MIYTYFKSDEKLTKISKSLLKIDNSTMTNLKLKKKISKLNEYQHFSLFCEIFSEASFHPFIKEQLIHFTRSLNKTNDIDSYFPRSNFNTSYSGKDYFLVMNCKKDLSSLVDYFLNTSEYPKQTLITKLLALKSKILIHFIKPLAIIIPTYKGHLQKSEKLFQENDIFIQDVIEELEDIEEKCQNLVVRIDDKIKSFSSVKKGSYLIDVKDAILRKLYDQLEVDFIDIHETTKEQFIEVLKSDWEAHKSIIHLKMDNIQFNYFIGCLESYLDIKISLTNIEYAGNIQNKNGQIKANAVYASVSKSNIDPKNIDRITAIFEKIKKG